MGEIIAGLPKLVAMCGAIGSGKDTVAGHLVKEYGFQPISIAGPLKEVAREIYGLEHRHVYGTQEDKAEHLPHVVGPDGCLRTPREILEWLGTEGFRTIDPDTWLNLALRSIENFRNAGHGCVVTDTRFANEFGALRKAGGVVWQTIKEGGRQEATGHESDAAWREYLRTNTPAAVLRAPHGAIDDLLTQADRALLA